MINHNNVYRPRLGVQFEPKLLLQRLQERWPRRIGLEIPTRRRGAVELGHKLDGEIQKSR